MPDHHQVDGAPPGTGVVEWRLRHCALESLPALTCTGLPGQRRPAACGRSSVGQLDHGRTSGRDRGGEQQDPRGAHGATPLPMDGDTWHRQTLPGQGDSWRGAGGRQTQCHTNAVERAGQQAPVRTGDNVVPGGPRRPGTGRRPGRGLPPVGRAQRREAVTVRDTSVRHSLWSGAKSHSTKASDAWSAQPSDRPHTTHSRTRVRVPAGRSDARATPSAGGRLR